MIKKALFVLLVATMMAACNRHKVRVHTTQLDSGTNSLLQAISIVDDRVAWVSGHNSTFLRTLDGGHSWQQFRFDTIDSLQFRDLHALSADEVILMSAGPGNASRIFRFNVTKGFEQNYMMRDSAGFLNSIEFWDDQVGLAFGDSYDWKMFALKTTDGGRTWHRINPKKFPEPGKGEGGFAASGTCIATLPGGKAWIGTGAGGNSRVLFTRDHGETWEEQPVPMVKGPSAGITSIRMANDTLGSIVGGDLAINDKYTENVAITDDGGVIWELTGYPITKGAFYGSDIIPAKKDMFLWMACGPRGIDYSTDLGLTYRNIDTTAYWAVDLDESGIGYATGPNGKILKIDFD